MKTDTLYILSPEIYSTPRNIERVRKCLLRCPACDGSDVYFIDYDRGPAMYSVRFHYWSVACGSCGLIAPRALRPADAARKFNGLNRKWLKEYWYAALRRAEIAEQKIECLKLELGRSYTAFEAQKIIDELEKNSQAFCDWSNPDGGGWYETGCGKSFGTPHREDLLVCPFCRSDIRWTP